MSFFGPKKTAPVLDKSHLREQRRHTAAVKEQNRLIRQQNKLMANQPTSTQGREDTTRKESGGLLSSVGNAITETLSELREDYRTYKAVQAEDLQRRAIERQYIGNALAERKGALPGDLLDMDAILAAELQKPVNPLTYSSVWNQLTAPGKPQVQLDSYFHATAPEDLASYLEALQKEERYPFTATLLTINLAEDGSGSNLLAAFARALAAHPNLYGSVGYNPRNLQKDQEAMDTHLTNLLNAENKILALGPIGLDGVYDPHSLPQQVKQLHNQLAIAADFELPVFLMNRKATKELKQAVTEAPARPPHIIYTKPIRTPEEIDLVKTLDAHILLRAEFSWPEEQVYRQAAMQEIPVNRWLLASGNGLAAAHSRRGQTNIPDTLQEVLAAASAASGREKNDLLTLLNTNAHRLFVR